MAKSSLSLLERFLLKVQIQTGNKCWLWLAGMNKDGYGRFKNPPDHAAPTTAYKLAYGSIPQGMWVLHRCDNPVCVRPSHLFLGTARDNSRDMLEKGRHAYGERNGGGVKLTNEKVVTMRAQHATGQFTFAHLGRLYGVSEITAGRVCKRQLWKHVL